MRREERLPLDEPARLHKPAVALIGDAKPILKRLLDELPKHNAKRASRRDEMERRQGIWRQRLLEGIGPQIAFLDAIRAELPEDGIFLVASLTKPIVSAAALVSAASPEPPQALRVMARVEAAVMRTPRVRRLFFTGWCSLSCPCDRIVAGVASPAGAGTSSWAAGWPVGMVMRRRPGWSASRSSPTGRAWSGPRPAPLRRS